MLDGRAAERCSAEADGASIDFMLMYSFLGTSGIRRALGGYLRQVR